MTTRVGGAVLQAVRAATVASSATDRELLTRFTGGDQAAFAALVRRHAAMVLGACRRTLPNVQDAEDACQATFLVLAKRAKDGHWQESIANWLYTTARRVASRAHRTAARRARWEARAAPPASESLLDQMTGREAFAALYEELDRLPAHNREPLILCYLEGLTRDEAAVRLGVPTATLKSQLDRGRKKLADALTKRGVALGAGLLAVAATSAAGASLPHLVESILTTASGRVPAAVGELAKGIAMNGSFHTGVFALVAGVAVALGAGSIERIAAGQPPNKPTPAGAAQPQDAPRKAAPKETTLTGRVLDPDGKPLAGAKLFAAPAEPVRGEGGLGNRRAQVTVPQAPPTEPLREVGGSGADGKFAVKVPASGATLSLVARAEGVGQAFATISADRLGAEVELRTVKDQVIRGRVVDTQGKPVAGAAINVSKLDAYDNGLDDFLAAHLRCGFPPTPGKQMPLTPRSVIVASLWRSAGVVPAATSDKDGRFTILGAGVERLVTLRVGGGGLADTELLVVNRKDFDPKPYNDNPAKPVLTRMMKEEFDVDSDVVAPVLHGPDVSAVVESEKRVRGTVTDVDTGKAVAGLTVTLVGHGSTVTDAAGRYEIGRARKSLTYVVAVDADPDTRHVATRVQVEDTVGYEPLTANIKVKKGVVITGKMIDTGTKKPVRGYVTVAVMRDNSFVKKYPTLGLTGDLVPTKEVLSPTREDGTFRIVTIPGPVLLFGGASGAALTQYKRPVADPKYPQYFSPDKLKMIGGGETAEAAPIYYGVGVSWGIVNGNFCKVLEIKADTETVTQDILLEPNK